MNRLKSHLNRYKQETLLSYSFTTPKYLELLNIKDKINPIKLMNPLGEDLSVMRTTLIHSMISTLYSNIVKGNKSADFFEISKTFISKDTEKDELPYENNRLAIGSYGENADFYRLKNLIINIISLFVEDYKLEYSNKPYFHNGISADIIVNNECIGSFGLIHPLVKKNYELEKDVYIADLDLDKIYEIRNNVYSYRSMSKFPMVERDLALLVKDNILSIDLINCIKENGGENLISVKVFDMYKGNQIEKGFKSLAYNLEFRADRTLTEQEVNDSIDKIIKNLREKYDAKIRE
jgi:phenylalanyl-tRNA synthetase beta chain